MPYSSQVHRLNVRATDPRNSPERGVLDGRRAHNAAEGGGGGAGPRRAGPRRTRAGGGGAVSSRGQLLRRAGRGMLLPHMYDKRHPPGHLADCSTWDRAKEASRVGPHLFNDPRAHASSARRHGTLFCLECGLSRHRSQRRTFKRLPTSTGCPRLQENRSAVVPTVLESLSRPPKAYYVETTCSGGGRPGIQMAT